jgi:hypothetical protein
MPGTTHASMHSAPLRKKSDALRSSARSGYLMRRLRHAVSRPCDAICAVLEPSAVLRVVRCGRCCSHTLQSTPCSTFVGPRRSIRMSSSGTTWPKRMPGSKMLRMKRSRAVSCFLYRPLTARPPADRFAIFASMERSSASLMTSSSDLGRFSDIVALHQFAATLRSGAATLRQWGGHASAVGRPRFPHSRKIAFPKAP